MNIKREKERQEIERQIARSEKEIIECSTISTLSKNNEWIALSKAIKAKIESIQKNVFELDVSEFNQKNNR